jgi:ribosomal protein L7/L12
MFTPRFDFAEAFYVDEEIRRLLTVNIQDGFINIISAIKYYRSVTGAGLVESKKYVEKIRDDDSFKHRLQALGK